MARSTVFELNKCTKPEIVFMITKKGIQQDLEVLPQEASSVFSDVSVFAYEIVQSGPNFVLNPHIALSEEDVAAKMRLLETYKTQKHLSYSNPDVVRSLAVRVRGRSIE